MVGDVAHQTDEDEIHRFMQRILDRKYLAVVLRFEIGEGVRSAPVKNVSPGEAE